MIAGEMTRRLTRSGIRLRRSLGGWSGKIHGTTFRASKTGRREWRIKRFHREFCAKTLGACVELFVRYVESENDQGDQCNVTIERV